MKRRAMVLAGGVWALSGCLSAGGTEADDPNETDSTDSPENNSTNETGIECENADGPADEDVTDRTDSIYVENYEESKSTVEVKLEHETEGVILENVYTVPARTGLEIPDVGKVREEYTVTFSYAGETEAGDWFVYSCETDCYGVVGRTAFVILIDAGRAYFGYDDCDTILDRPSRDLEYETHEEYMRD